jgi:5-amino-6-(5-phosphoribosylamino)uracil reductase
LPSHASGDTERPFVFINMVSTVDGKTDLGGKASGIGSMVDRRVMRTLRSKADAVMIGGGTVRAEKLSLSLDAGDPRPRPLAVILTNTGDVPLESNLVRDPSQNVLVLLSEGAGESMEPRITPYAEVRRVPTSRLGLIDLATSLETLKAKYSVGRLLVEGGPTLNQALIFADLADELFVTLAPKLLSGSPPGTHSIMDGFLGEPRSLRLLSAYLARDELFLRYALNPNEQSS